MLVTALLAAAPIHSGAAQQPLSTFKDCADCPTMVVMPAGRFLMGTAPDPYKLPPSRRLYPEVIGVQRFNDQFTIYDAPNEEQPQHEVAIAAFAIGKFELTQAEWRAVMGNNPSANAGPNLPVDSISWDDVQAFVAKLNAKTGKTYRLPTEAEWEYAARGGTTTQFSFGEDARDVGRYAWYARNTNLATQPVGTKEPNPFGLHDVHGNVWEWVQDCYRGNYDGAPVNGAAVDAPSCTRVIRGGQWGYDEEYMRTAARVRFNQGETGMAVGVRLARNLP
jgi:formylglycine-generating enzyme required for sulfatase activity